MLTLHKCKHFQKVKNWKSWSGLAKQKSSTMFLLTEWEQGLKCHSEQTGFGIELKLLPENFWWSPEIVVLWNDKSLCPQLLLITNLLKWDLSPQSTPTRILQENSFLTGVVVPEPVQLSLSRSFHFFLRGVFPGCQPWASSVKEHS